MLWQLVLVAPPTSFTKACRVGGGSLSLSLSLKSGCASCEMLMMREMIAEDDAEESRLVNRQCIRC